jgi:hypothetical protein
MSSLARTVLPIALALSACFSLFGQGLVSANGHELFLDCRGTAPGPTVILLAGGGGTTSTWDKVQPQVSAFARVCSYDRAGLGQSSDLQKPQSADQIVDDLAALLKAARLSPPYVLVGHSIGGLYARKFDARYDSEVAGIVLVDSAHEEQIWRFAEGEPDALAEYPDWKNPAVMSAQGFLPPKERVQWHFTKPLIVLEHGIPPEPVWHEMQKDLASRSPEGKLITATKSSHYIQKLQPELVIESIRAVLSQAASSGR